MNAEQFNALHPVGTPVIAYPGCRPEDCPNDERLVTRTRSKAEVLGGHTDVVWVDGHSACIALSHVDVVSEDVWKAAKEADDLAAAVASKAKAAEDAADCRRRIYVDGKGDGWIDLSIDPETGERELTGITNPWKIASAEDVRNDTGGLTEIGRCW
ncbi:hypothetical protein M2155_000674 [Streptomyces sp. SAI-119]|uniref:hypothetical protein n=1 Tax=Streptomyces sp. SAI-119 TaxID=2940541 RepID=UPI0024759226|nr:hypothetical protein [Streptomyces sp. SAI-119]MDH6448266.1 hypothetical protein [Streptomyces sp. SAI-119]